MKNIYIFGRGKGSAFVERCLLREKADLIGFIDNYKADSLSEINGVPIIKQGMLSDYYDYIVISLMKYDEAKQSLIREGVNAEKIICFFDYADADNEEYWCVLDSYKWRIELMWKHYREITIPTLDNLNYEIYGESEIIESQSPKIIDVDKTADILLKERKCLARFGDGEFELICKKARPKFQKVDERLAQRLREALNSKEDNLLVAIANDYGRLDQYTDEAAEDIRSYMSKTVRREHMEILDLDRVYYDAFISRPYIIYRDKKGAGKRFANVRRIWNNEDVLIVEGEHTRFGVGNDLLDNAAQISRILVPDQNAFSLYDKIISEVRQQGRNRLILAIIGPTASVLSYDLAKEGYWIIDIGQLDVEYEWYLRGVDKRCDIPYKCVSEVSQYDEIPTDNKKNYIQKYEGEIIAKIL